MIKKYCIFSDESGQDGSNRYTSLAAISASQEDAKQLNTELKLILKEFDKSEIKFKLIKNNKSKLISLRFINTIIPYLKRGKIWIHVLVWDKQDARHQVRKRDDEANLMRMYYKLLLQVRKNWGNDDEWGFYPDEYSAIDWKEDVVKYLDNTVFNREKDQTPALFRFFYQEKISKFMNICELKSSEYPIIQLADLLAGIVRTSRSNMKFHDWYQENANSSSTLFEKEHKINISNSERPKFEVMKYFKDVAGKYKLGVNLSKYHYFTKFNHKYNIVIMHYEPQSVHDKAPARG